MEASLVDVHPPDPPGGQTPEQLSSFVAPLGIRIMPRRSGTSTSTTTTTHSSAPSHLNPSTTTTTTTVRTPRLPLTRSWRESFPELASDMIHSFVTTQSDGRKAYGHCLTRHLPITDPSRLSLIKLQIGNLCLSNTDKGEARMRVLLSAVVFEPFILCVMTQQPVIASMRRVLTAFSRNVGVGVGFTGDHVRQLHSALTSSPPLLRSPTDSPSPSSTPSPSHPYVQIGEGKVWIHPTAAHSWEQLIPAPLRSRSSAPSTPRTSTAVSPPSPSSSSVSDGPSWSCPRCRHSAPLSPYLPRRRCVTCGRCDVCFDDDSVEQRPASGPGLPARPTRATDSQLWASPCPSCLPVMDVDYGTLFSRLEPRHVVSLVMALFLEKSVFVVSKDVSVLTEVMLAASSLLYPLEWMHLFIPVMPFNCPFIDVIFDAPTPAFVGLHTSVMKAMSEPVDDGSDGSDDNASTSSEDEDGASAESSDDDEALTQRVLSSLPRLSSATAQQSQSATSRSSVSSQTTPAGSEPVLSRPPIGSTPPLHSTPPLFSTGSASSGSTGLALGASLGLAALNTSVPPRSSTPKSDASNNYAVSPRRLSFFHQRLSNSRPGSRRSSLNPASATSSPRASTTGRAVAGGPTGSAGAVVSGSGSGTGGGGGGGGGSGTRDPQPRIWDRLTAFFTPTTTPASTPTSSSRRSLTDPFSDRRRRADRRMEQYRSVVPTHAVVVDLDHNNVSDNAQEPTHRLPARLSLRVYRAILRHANVFSQANPKYPRPPPPPDLPPSASTAEHHMVDTEFNRFRDEAAAARTGGPAVSLSPPTTNGGLRRLSSVPRRLQPSTPPSGISDGDFDGSGDGGVTSGAPGLVSLGTLDELNSDEEDSGTQPGLLGVPSALTAPWAPPPGLTARTMPGRSGSYSMRRSKSVMDLQSTPDAVDKLFAAASPIATADEDDACDVPPMGSDSEVKVEDDGVLHPGLLAQEIAMALEDVPSTDVEENFAETMVCATARVVLRPRRPPPRAPGGTPSPAKPAPARRTPNLTVSVAAGAGGPLLLTPAHDSPTTRSTPSAVSTSAPWLARLSGISGEGVHTHNPTPWYYDRVRLAFASVFVSLFKGFRQYLRNEEDEEELRQQQGQGQGQGQGQEQGAHRDDGDDGDSSSESKSDGSRGAATASPTPPPRRRRRSFSDLFDVELFLAEQVSDECQDLVRAVTRDSVALRCFVGQRVAGSSGNSGASDVDFFDRECYRRMFYTSWRCSTLANKPLSGSLFVSLDGGWTKASVELHRLRLRVMTDSEELAAAQRRYKSLKTLLRVGGSDREAEELEAVRDKIADLQALACVVSVNLVPGRTRVVVPRSDAFMFRTLYPLQLQCGGTTDSDERDTHTGTDTGSASVVTLCASSSAERRTWISYIKARLRPAEYMDSLRRQYLERAEDGPAGFDFRTEQRALVGRFMTSLAASDPTSTASPLGPSPRKFRLARSRSLSVSST